MLHSQKVHHPQLVNHVETIRSSNSLRPGGLTVAEVNNYLTVRFSELPDYLVINMNISTVNLSSSSSPESGIYGPGGKIFT